MTKKKVLVALYNMGGPNSLEDVERFLRALFTDPDLLDIPMGAVLQQQVAGRIIKSRLEEVKERYELMGGHSPQLEITTQLAQETLGLLSGTTLPGGFELVDVMPLMRYSAPRASDVLARMEREGIDELWLYSQYPHCARATTGSSLRELGLLLREKGYTTGSAKPRPIRVRSFAPYFDEPDFLEIWTARLREAWAALSNPRKFLIVSAHNLPLSYIAQGDPYPAQIYRTVREVCRRLGLHEGTHWRLAWQSAVGPVRWMTPDTRDVIAQAVAAGAESLLMWPVSFVSDHIETLIEIDMDFLEIAQKAGAKQFVRTPNLNADKDFSHYVAKSIERAAGDLARFGESPLLRDLFTRPSGEGCEQQPGGCLCGRYFEAGCNGRERGTLPRPLPRYEPDAHDQLRTFSGNALPLAESRVPSRRVSTPSAKE